MNSRAKGKRFELTLARMLRADGYEARRGQQFSGANGDADVVGLPGIHIEAKHAEQFRIYDWMDQAKRDARDGELPAVFFKKNNSPVLVTMTYDDWITMYKEADFDKG